VIAKRRMGSFELRRILFAGKKKHITVFYRLYAE